MIFQKNIWFHQLTRASADAAKIAMLDELSGLPSNHQLRELFGLAWQAYRDGVFAYDGATFVKERDHKSLFEVAAFIHDYRNSLGYVGQRIDREMFDIMITLNYSLPYIIRRWFMTRLTWINVVRHKCKMTYRSTTPIDLYKLSNQ